MHKTAIWNAGIDSFGHPGLWANAVYLWYSGKKIDLTQRGGELTEDKEEHIFGSRQNSQQHRIPSWCLVWQKDVKDGRNNKITANGVDNKSHEELRQLEKIQEW